MTPFITINKIVLGYRLSAKEEVIIKDLINKLTCDYEVKPKVEYSVLKKYFEDK
ncbi:MAG: hypothetical protein IPJ79_02915 [Bacteroidetes bacterium]|nr:hypothetical protein [Bacteroidota bacterium]